MTISLYEISIASYLRTVGGAAKVMEKGKAHCSAEGIDIGAVVQTRLHPDMLPFSFQVHSVVHHSLGAIRAIEAGEFRPPADLPELDYEGLENLLAQTRSALEGYSREAVDALEGRDVVFIAGDRKLPFTAENFVLSFSLPNLYFHAATAYDILRMQGAPLSKRDFMGRLPLKQ